MSDLSLGLDETTVRDSHASATVREIAQQPRLWRETGASVATRGQEIAAFLGPLLADQTLRILLTGAGTSAFAGEILAPGLAAELDRPVEAVATTDIVAVPRQAFPNRDRPTLPVSFARSGNSPESVAATELADACLDTVRHLVLTCNGNGELRRRHDGRSGSLVLLMPEGADDQGFAMTSSVTAMMLAAALALLGDRAPPNLVEELAATAEWVLAERAAEIRDLAATGPERIVYLGNGPLKGLAQEAALKVLELTGGQVIAHGEAPMAFRHGPKSMLNDRTLALVFLSNDPYTRRYDLDILAELRAQLGPTRAVAISAGEGGDAGGGALWHLSGLDDAPDWLIALPFLVHAQLIGLHSSLARGRTPDNPFPAGEVNRVVQGVTIHPFLNPRS